jgi:hypothetical protein
VAESDTGDGDGDGDGPPGDGDGDGAPGDGDGDGDGTPGDGDGTPGDGDGTPGDGDGTPGDGDGDGDGTPGCTYPDYVEPMAVNEVLAPYSWPMAIHGDGTTTPLALTDAYCDTDAVIDWSIHELLVFISIPAW